MTSPRQPIQQAAEAFTASYARTMQLSDPATSSVSDDISLIAHAVAQHYGPTTQAFTMGHSSRVSNSEADVASVAQHLQRFERAGVGYNIFLEKSKVDVLSDGAAVCWLTWAIKPRAGCSVEGWSWVNIYTYRRSPVAAEDVQVTLGSKGNEWIKPEGWWEAIIADNEMGELLKRFPDFMKE